MELCSEMVCLGDFYVNMLRFNDLPTVRLNANLDSLELHQYIIGPFILLNLVIVTIIFMQMIPRCFILFNRMNIALNLMVLNHFQLQK